MSFLTRASLAVLSKFSLKLRWNMQREVWGLGINICRLGMDKIKEFAPSPPSVKYHIELVEMNNTQLCRMLGCTLWYEGILYILRFNDLFLIHNMAYTTGLCMLLKTFLSNLIITWQKGCVLTKRLMSCDGLGEEVHHPPAYYGLHREYSSSQLACTPWWTSGCTTGPYMGCLGCGSTGTEGLTVS